MNLVPAGFVSPNFRKRYWRRRPLRLPASQTDALVHNLRHVDYAKVIKKLRTLAPWQVRRTSDTVFCQAACKADVALRQIAVQFSKYFRVPNLWIDVVQNSRPFGSVGSHFDTSDNFTIQVSGNKYWRLEKPLEADLTLARKYLALRLPDTPKLKGSGQVFECELQEGEALYIPLFWMHEGVSRGPAVSVSVVLNAETWLDALYFVCWHLADTRKWGYPLPVLDGEELPAGKTPADTAQLLISALASDSEASRLLKEWYELRAERFLTE